MGNVKMSEKNEEQAERAEKRNRTFAWIGLTAFLACLIVLPILNVYVQNSRSAEGTPYRNNSANISGEDASSDTENNIIENSDFSPEDDVLTEKNSRTLKDFLLHALEPVGSTLYIYGGGWNEEDTGAGAEAMAYGPSPRWKEFFDENNETYDQEKHKYEIHNGLDCTGYLGYAVFQVFGDRYAKDGYVFASGTVGENFVRLFGGSITPKDKIKKCGAGDIMEKKGHVFIMVGECDDGSRLLLHSSPPAVTLSGTPTRNGKEDSEAERLARKYMERIAPEAYGRYPKNCVRGETFLTDFDAYTFPEEVLPDPDGLREMSAAEVLTELIG